MGNYSHEDPEAVSLLRFAHFRAVSPKARKPRALTQVSPCHPRPTTQAFGFPSPLCCCKALHVLFCCFGFMGSSIEISSNPFAACLLREWRIEGLGAVKVLRCLGLVVICSAKID